MNKRIIICGPGAGGKDFLKKKFARRGFSLDVSYTTRPPREGEVDGVDYHFMDEMVFHQSIYDMYETAQHGKYWYGTGQKEWDADDIFIMETHGISEITAEDRRECFIIYLNPPEHERVRRMRVERKWDWETIQHRLEMDNKKFGNFKDFDIQITNPDF